MHYQALLRDQSDIQLFKTSAINPASLQPGDNSAEALHYFMKVTDVLQSNRPYLTDVLMQKAKEVLWEQFCSRWNQVRWATAITLDRTVWALSFSQETLIQKSGLLALIQEQGKAITRYTDNPMHFP